VLGASFDTVEDNRAFAEAESFGFRLLSDTERSVGRAYDATRPDDDPLAALPKRVSYLIDPDGVIRRSYTVTDTAGHAAEVLAELQRLGT
jgi:thioredoxin-dependent peroxiredoxin